MKAKANISKSPGSVEANVVRRDGTTMEKLGGEIREERSELRQRE